MLHLKAFKKRITDAIEEFANAGEVSIKASTNGQTYDRYAPEHGLHKVD